MTTKRVAIDAALAVSEDIYAGRIDPAELNAELVEQCRQIVGQVVGEGDSLFGLQRDIARGVLAVGGIPVNELGEWLALACRRTGQPSEAP